MTRDQREPGPGSNHRDSDHTPLDQEHVPRGSSARRALGHLKLRDARTATILCQPNQRLESKLLISLAELSFKNPVQPKGVQITELLSLDIAPTDKKMHQLVRETPFKFLIEKGLLLVLQEQDAPYAYLSTRGAKVVSAILFEKRLTNVAVPEGYHLGETLERWCRSLARGELLVFHPVPVTLAKEIMRGVSVREVVPPRDFNAPTPIPPQPKPAAVPVEQPITSVLMPPLSAAASIATPSSTAPADKLRRATDLLLSIAFEGDNFHLPQRTELLKALSAAHGYERAVSEMHPTLTALVQQGLIFVLRSVSGPEEWIVPTPKLLSGTEPNIRALPRAAVIERVLASRCLEPDSFFTRFPRLGEVILHPAYRDQLPSELRGVLDQQLKKEAVARERRALEEQQARLVYKPIKPGESIEVKVDESFRVGPLIVGWGVISSNSFCIWRDGRASTPMQVGKRWKIPLGKVTTKQGEEPVEAFMRIRATAIEPNEIDKEFFPLGPPPRFAFEINIEPPDLKVYKFRPKHLR